MPTIVLISVLIFVLGLFSRSFSEIISLKAFQQHHSTGALSQRSKLPPGYRFVPPIAASSGHQSHDELTLLDIVLLASVDGKFHALNRTTGQILWSMSSSSLSSANILSTLGPLVRTAHVESDPDLTDEDSPDQELYVVEPQSGDIYILPSPNSPLQRLSFSMSQLVDVSPYSFPGDENPQRMFVGKKETSLLVLELETGKLKASLNTECPWSSEHEDHGNDLDIDELEGSTEKCTSTEIYIGRTDYSLSIISRPRDSSPAPPTQNLSFSTYSPNNQDSALQSTYHRTADDVYIQSLPNGVIFSLKAGAVDSADPSQGSPFLWHQRFNDPIVAVFDIVKSPDRSQPFALLQPRPRLQDVFPGHVNFPNRDSAYIGLVNETGSLFAMTPNLFPLVAFADDHDVGPELIDGPSGPGAHTNGDGTSATDSSESTRNPKGVCRNGSPDRRCLTGVRPLSEDSLSRSSRMLDGVPSVELLPDQTDALFNHDNDLPHSSSWNNLSIVPTWIWGQNHSLSGPELSLGLNSSKNVFSAIGSLTSALLLGLFWIFYRNGKLSKPRQIPSKQNGVDLPRVPVAIEQPLIVPLPSTFASPTSPSAPQEVAALTNGAPVFFPEPESVEIPPPPPPNPDNNAAEVREEANDWEESEKEGEGAAVPTKRKGRRGKRGRKKKVVMIAEEDPEKEETRGKLVNGNGNANLGEPELPPEEVVLPPPLLPPLPSTTNDHVQPSSSLIVSETILGYGSHGTVVFQGSFQGRSVAVKRLLRDFVTLASREVSILQESDDHPNVIRYYYQEAHANFLYIALELCPASLADIIENPDQFPEISATFDPKRALRQIASGLRHLHGLKLVHRDIKPQNILISTAKSGGGGSSSSSGHHRTLISDFGLCKKLDVDQTSFLPTTHGSMAVGTVGWRAPEILRGEVKLDDGEGDEHSHSSSRGSVGTPNGGNGSAGKPTRLTKSVDIFALGCLFYYTLTNGGHPFGDRFEREMNILKDMKNLDGLETFGEEGSEAADLIARMLKSEAQERPDTTTCLVHPFFWDSARRLTFLQDASDRFEIMCRDPRDPNLITLETSAIEIVGNDWHTRLDKVFIENLGKFRKYDGRSVQDLLRALRNKKHHYQDLPDNVKRHLGPMPHGFLWYFTRRYPRLILHVHSVIANTPLCQESMFRPYFEHLET